MLHIVIALYENEALLWIESRSAQRFDPAESPTDLAANISMAIRAIICLKRIFPLIAKVLSHTTNPLAFEEICSAIKWVIHELHILADKAPSSGIRLWLIWCAAVNTAILSL